MEKRYVQSWAISVGIDNATKFEQARVVVLPAARARARGAAAGRDAGCGLPAQVLRAAVEGALVAALLEPVLVPAQAWFEQHVDFLSVHARLATRAGGGWAARTAMAIRHYATHIES